MDGRRRARARRAHPRTAARRAGEEVPSYELGEHGSPDRDHVAEPPDVAPAQLAQVLDVGLRVEPIADERHVEVPCPASRSRLIAATTVCESRGPHVQSSGCAARTGSSAAAARASASSCGSSSSSPSARAHASSRWSKRRLGPPGVNGRGEVVAHGQRPSERDGPGAQRRGREQLASAARSGGPRASGSVTLISPSSTRSSGRASAAARAANAERGSRASSSAATSRTGLRRSSSARLEQRLVGVAQSPVSSSLAGTPRGPPTSPRPRSRRAARGPRPDPRARQPAQQVRAASAVVPLRLRRPAARTPSAARAPRASARVARPRATRAAWRSGRPSRVVEQRGHELGRRPHARPRGQRQPLLDELAHL